MLVVWTERYTYISTIYCCVDNDLTIFNTENRKNSHDRRTDVSWTAIMCAILSPLPHPLYLVKAHAPCLVPAIVLLLVGGCYSYEHWTGMLMVSCYFSPCNHTFTRVIIECLMMVHVCRTIQELPADHGIPSNWWICICKHWLDRMDWFYHWYVCVSHAAWSQHEWNSLADVEFFLFSRLFFIITGYQWNRC